MLGVPWGADQAAVRERLAGLSPGVDDERVLVYPLGSVAERLMQEGAFCPTALGSGPERVTDEVVFNFLDGQLAAGFVRFGYAVEAIGHDPDTLSDQVMAAIARAELQQLVVEMAVAHGAPALFTEQPLRMGKLHGVGAALWEDGESVVHVLFGHDGGTLAGELRYMPRIAATNGV